MKRIQYNPNLELQFWDKIEAFKSNPFDPSLRTHKLSGRLQHLWSFSIGYDLRVVFEFVNSKQVVFIDVGSQKEVY